MILEAGAVNCVDSGLMGILLHASFINLPKELIFLKCAWFQALEALSSLFAENGKDRSVLMRRADNQRKGL